MDLKNSFSVQGFASLDGRVVSDFQEAEKVATEITGKAMRELRKKQKKNLKRGKKSFP